MKLKQKQKANGKPMRPSGQPKIRLTEVCKQCTGESNRKISGMLERVKRQRSNKAHCLWHPDEVIREKIGLVQS